MKRRNECEEHHVEMNGWNGYTNSDLSPAPTPTGPRGRGSRAKTVKQTKNGPQTPGPSGIGRTQRCRAVLLPLNTSSRLRLSTEVFMITSGISSKMIFS